MRGGAIWRLAFPVEAVFWMVVSYARRRDMFSCSVRYLCLGGVCVALEGMPMGVRVQVVS